MDIYNGPWIEIGENDFLSFIDTFGGQTHRLERFPDGYIYSSLWVEIGEKRLLSFIDTFGGQTPYVTPRGRGSLLLGFETKETGCANVFDNFENFRNFKHGI